MLEKKSSTADLPRFQGGLADDVLRRVVAYVQTNLGEHISLEQLAASAGMSRFHFARQFRISTGQSPMGFVRQARIERATTILRERNITIARVAVSLGFADQSHFTRTFGRFVGVSPKSFADGHWRAGLSQNPPAQEGGKSDRRRGTRPWRRDRTGLVS